jgi:calcineurin-like phosphoesterase family protein
MKIHKNDCRTLFFTSDTHFGHQNIIKYCSRPWTTADEMTEGLIANWNDVVPADGIVIHAGDVAFCDPVNIIPRLNGKIILVRGNHDRAGNDRLYWHACDYLNLRAGKQRIIVLHYAMRTGDQAIRGSWHFYGHSHGTLPPLGKSWDIGVDANAYKPRSLTEMSVIMSNQPDNVDIFK